MLPRIFWAGLGKFEQNFLATPKCACYTNELRTLLMCVPNNLLYLQKLVKRYTLSMMRTSVWHWFGYQWIRKNNVWNVSDLVKK